MGLRIGVVIRPMADEEELELMRAQVDRLREAGHRVRPRVTFEPGDGVRSARAIARWRADLIIAAGGDGTVNEVVNGIGRSSWQPRLGIVPLGTANDFAEGLSLPRRAPDAVDVAVGGTPIAVDVGRVNGRRFINVSTGGFGAEASESASSETKRRLGAWAYVITGVREFVELKPARARFTSLDGSVLHDGRFLIFAVGNGRRTGGGSRVTPHARLTDGQLDVLIVPAMPRVDLLALLPDLRAGRHLDRADVIYGRTRGLTVVADRRLGVNADGEAMHGRSFRYRVESRPLSVMTPE